MKSSLRELDLVISIPPVEAATPGLVLEPIPIVAHYICGTRAPLIRELSMSWVERRWSSIEAKVSMERENG